MPRRSEGKVQLSLLGVSGWLCAIAGTLGWIGVGVSAISGSDDVTPQSDEGGRLMRWALTGTLLMILGVVLLQLAEAGADGQSEEEQPPPLTRHRARGGVRR